MTGVREKANYASQQLRTATQRADLQIKLVESEREREREKEREREITNSQLFRELCQGVESLKIVSELLENIDSIYEVRH